MSNTKLECATIPGYAGPFYPNALDQVQECYVVRRFNKRPITLTFLEWFAEELGGFFKRTNIRPNFTTADGAQWTSLSFLYVNDVKCRVLFSATDDKKHANGTVSSQHIALYIDNSDEEPSEQMIDQLGRSIAQLFRYDLNQFYP